MGGRVIVGSIVASRGDKENSNRIGKGNGIPQGRRFATSPPTCIDNSGIVVCCVNNSLSCICIASSSPDGDAPTFNGFDKFQGHQLGVEVHSCNPFVIIPDSSDDTGDVCTMVMIVHGIAVLICEIIPVDIIDVTV